MTDERSAKRFPNIEMCGRGCTSGSWNEWPVLRAECRAILALLAEKDAERDRLAKQVERLRGLLSKYICTNGMGQFLSSPYLTQDELLLISDAALTEQPHA